MNKSKFIVFFQKDLSKIPSWKFIGLSRSGIECTSPENIDNVSILRLYRKNRNINDLRVTLIGQFVVLIRALRKPYYCAVVGYDPSKCNDEKRKLIKDIACQLQTVFLEVESINQSAPGNELFWDQSTDKCPEDIKAIFTDLGKEELDNKDLVYSRVKKYFAEKVAPNWGLVLNDNDTIVCC